MKKYMLIICLLLTAALCFAACTQTKPESTEPSTQATEPSASPSTPTDPSEPTEPTDPTDPTQPPLSAKEQMLIAELTKAYNEDFWLSRALCSTFEDPRNIDMDIFVYLGMEEDIRWSDFSEAEQKFLLDHYMAAAAKRNNKPVTELTEQEKEDIRIGVKETVKLPAKELDAVLQKVLGVSLTEVTIGTDMLYYAAADAYYVTNFDAYLMNPRFDYVAESSDGVVHVYYHHSGFGEDIHWTQEHYDGPFCYARLKRLPDGGFRVLSNVEITSGKT